MKTLALLLGLLLAAAPVLAQNDPPPGLPITGQVDQSEIIRWGDRAIVSGEGPKAADELLYSMAMAPPADDSDQWYVTVFGRSNDPATLGVVKAFETDAHLAAFVAAPPGEGKRAWAHFNVYFADDPMQGFRFKEFQIDVNGAFPVVVIQPPRDGSFGGIITTQIDGKPATRQVVIDRINAGDIGKPADVQKRISGSVALWCHKLQASGFVPPIKVAKKVSGEQRSEPRLVKSDSHGQVAFPWGPATPPAQPAINPQWPAGGPANVANPIQGFDPSGLLRNLLNPNMLVIAIWLWEMFAPAFGFKGTVVTTLLKQMLKLWKPDATPADQPTPVLAPAFPPLTAGWTWQIVNGQPVPTPPAQAL
jgi:hypothetical protein